MTIEQSFAWWSFAQDDTDPRALLRAAAEIGYTGVDLLDPDLWPVAADVGLRLAAVGGHASLTRGLNDPTQHARIHGELLASLKLAEEHDIATLIVFSGNRPGDGGDGGVAATVDALGAIAPHAEAAGVTLVLELLNSRVDHPDYAADRTAWGVQVVEAVASPRVKLLYDVYHMQIMEGDLIRTIRANHPHIGHYHTAGNPGRHDLDDEQEIAYSAVFRAVQASGFDGFIAHEFVPKGEPITALRRAFELCRAATG